MAKHPTIKFIPVGGLDFDSDNSKVEATDYRNAENMRNSVSYSGQQFVPCNMKGNVLVAYNMTSGDCRCLGGVEDKEFNTILYFVWSSDNKHKILRYYPGLVDNLNPFGQIQLVTEFDFKWKKNERITGVDFIDGKLLYWTDKIQPRMVNAIKSNNTNKLKQWIVRLAISYNAVDNFNIIVTDNSGAIVATQPIVLGPGTREEKFKLIADAINDPLQVLHTFLTAEACDCELKITEKVVNAYNIAFMNLSYKVTPENWYGANLVNRFFDAGKYPPGCQPEPAYKKDPSKNFNFVKDKVFFFRLGYEYDNFEESKLGPISTVLINNQKCNQGLYESFNYIDIDFNDPNLIDPNIWVILKKVGIYVQEHNSGDWLKVGSSIEICDFFDLVDGNEAAHFKFYNNINTAAISTVLAQTQYDNLPILANAQKFAKNKLTYAGITEGLDAPDCAEAELDVAFNEVQQQEYFTVTIRVRIANPTFDGTSMNGAGIPRPMFNVGWSSQALYNWIATGPNPMLKSGCIVRNDASTYPSWGGCSKDEVRTDQSGHDQLMPLGGFLLYSAGTPFYGISKQDNLGGLKIDEFGAFMTVAPFDAQIKSWLGRGGLLAGTGEVYSTVTLRLPKGKHIIRLASHLCSYGDELKRGKIYDVDTGLYHLTSTNTFMFADPNGNWVGDTEMVINVTGDGFYGTAYVADSMIRDHDSRIMHIVYGYLMDINLFNILGQIPTSVGMEKQTVFLNFNGSAFDPNALPQNIHYNTATYTDHNGYFYMIFEQGGAVTGCSVIAMGADNQVLSAEGDQKYYGDIGQIYDNVILPHAIPLSFSNNGQAFIYNNPRLQHPDQYYNVLGQQISGTPANIIDISQVAREIIILNSNVAYRTDYCTVIKGKFEDLNAVPICCTGAVLTRTGRAAKSDHSGIFTILAFANGRHFITHGPYDGNYFPMTIASLGAPAQIVEQLILSSGECVADFGGVYSHSIYVQPIAHNNTAVPPPYSSTAFYDVGTYVFSLLNPDFVKSGKRGGKYDLVLRYQDELGRQCSCVKGGELYIPFFGEDLNKYFPNRYAPGTFSMGYPIITWTLPATFKPPKWATKYQWLRTKNLHQADYIQWLINDVKYVVTANAGVSVDTTFNAYNANQIWVSLSNIQEYINEHPSAKVKYQFAEGQRIRFITDENGVGLQKYVDAPIVGVQDNWLKLDYFNDFGEIKTAMRVEATGIRKINAIDVYYECGECYPCTHPGFDDNAHSVLTAPFKWGDTYWVSRNIPIRDETGLVLNTNLIYFVESNSVNDFYDSQDEDLGRPGIITIKLRQIYRGNAFRVSGAYIPDTGVNGLSSFTNVDDVELGKEFGAVMKLEISGFVMAAICENKFVSNYLGAIQGATPVGGLVISSQQGYVGDSRPLIGDFGTQHPATVVQKDGWIWGVDFERGIAWKYDNNGMDIISDKKAMTFFNLLSQAGIWDAVAAFDAFYNEYIVTAWVNKYDTTQFTSFDEETGLLKITTPNPNEYIIGEVIEVTFKDGVSNELITAMGTVTDVTGNVVTVYFEQYVYHQTNFVDALFAFQAYTSNGPTITINKDIDFTGMGSITIQGTTYSNNNHTFPIISFTHNGGIFAQTTVVLPFSIVLLDDLSNGRVVFGFDLHKHISPSGEIRVRMRGGARTIAYQKDKQRWTTFYSYVGDNICPVGFDFVSWKNGQLYLHDVGLIGTFYGIYYKWKLKAILYMDGYPELLWDSIYLEQLQNDQNKVQNWSIPVITNELNQLSRITKGAFQKLEEFWNAWFRKDLNTLSVANPIGEGKDLRSSVIILEMENDAIEKAELRAVNVIVNESSGNR